jgi:[ribosomal protein S18]-alanine N-acetyltransferase
VLLSDIIAKKNIGNDEFFLQYMREKDLDAVLQIESKSALSPWTEHQFRSEFTNTFSKLFIVSASQHIVAFAIAWYAADEIQIANLAIESDFRRIGIATFLLNTIFQRAIDNGFRSAHLEVRYSNIKAVSLYKNLGFQISGVRKKYYSSPTEDAYLMSALLA